MNINKPLHLGLLHRTFQHEGRARLVVTVLAGFKLDEPDALLFEPSLWDLAGEELQGGVLDEGLPKPASEVLVTGSAFAPGGEAVTGVEVRAKVGAVEKTLYAVGDRHWTGSRPSEPVPFLSMPLDWSRAFGGEGFDQNPLGRGLAVTELEPGVKAQLLPNIEDPRDPVTSPRHRPPPAGLGAMDASWPQRFSLLGTYDAAWHKERFPGFADDFDVRHFHAAAEDQRLDGFFAGGEEIVLENLHPEQPKVTSMLPKWQGRAFVEQWRGDDLEFDEVPMRLETVHLFPHRLAGILLYRGVLGASCMADAGDIGTLLVGLDDADELRSADHFRQVLELRGDEEEGALHSLSDRDLVPTSAKLRELEQDAPPEWETLLERVGLLEANVHRGAVADAEAMRALVAEQGGDPSVVSDPPPLPEPGAEGEDPVEAVRKAKEEQRQAEEQAKRDAEQTEEEARADYAAMGMDYDALKKEAEEASGGPPSPEADVQLAELRELVANAASAGTPAPHIEALLADPAYEQKLRLADTLALITYRMTAHEQPPAKAASPERSAELRELAVAAHRAGDSLASFDFTGADLSGLDLAGVDLSEALCERASFAGSDLSGANLSRAVLARANFEGTNLNGATLRGANLGRAELVSTRLDGADLQSTWLTKATLRDTSLRGARLDGADLVEATFDGSDLSEGSAQGVILHKADLRGLCLAGADLSHCNIIESNLDGVDLSGANLEEATFVTVSAAEAKLTGAKLGSASFVLDCSLPGADLQGVEGPDLNLRGANLEGADLREAQLDGADLSECNLRSANLYRASAKGAALVRADLREADLTGANLMDALLGHTLMAGTTCKGANLCRADLMFAEGDERTSFEDALVDQVAVAGKGKGS